MKVAGLHISGNNAVDAIAVAVCAWYTLISAETLTPSTTFAMWVVLSILHGKVFRFPVACREVSEAIAALQRILLTISPPAPHDQSRNDESLGLHVSNLIASWNANATSKHEAPGHEEKQTINQKGVIDEQVLDQKGVSVHVSTPHSEFQLQVHNLTVPHGNLCGVCGAVGSGKSSLLHGILAEMAVFPGASQLFDANSVGFVPQVPVIFNGSVQNNITMHRPLDLPTLQAVCAATGLDKDLETFSKSLDTSVSGLSLSGGQQARIGLARCLYARPQLALLDAVLAALDTRVAAHVFEEAICA